MRAGFSLSNEREPHAERRRRLLERYPQVKELYGPCPRTKYVCTALVAAQLGLAYAVRDAPWWALLLVAYGVGGIINQALLLAIHELSHNLAFKKPWHNRAFALFVNLPVGVPVAETFRYYHLLHHTHQGDDALDTDLPTELEARLLQNRGLRLLWLAGQGFAYGLRPLFVHPKRPDRGEVLNLALQVAFNVAIFYLWGGKALAYLPISSLIVMGLHPIAGHYISEHYVFRPGQETYSYYGPLNWLAFHVGYHNEHHDFPYIAGSRLARLRALAPEFYESLYAHTSWSATLWRFITEPTLGGYSRVKRRRAGESL
ncbi:MAG: Dihydrosphingosine delta-4 desaturase [Polyangiaceae bacterium]|jgi:sphingolipid delta-4 desaturase|nr:Dihydrosphingosine delta-4 desaturase [Polyangiaceae bacterium]